MLQDHLVWKPLLHHLLRLPKIALPTGDSLEIRLLNGSASEEPTITYSIHHCTSYQVQQLYYLQIQHRPLRTRQ